MARTTFSRTVVKTICDVSYFDQDNTLQHGEVELFGDYDKETAQRPALKKLNAKGGVVNKVIHTSYYGSMDIVAFDHFCTKKDFKEW